MLENNRFKNYWNEMGYKRISVANEELIPEGALASVCEIKALSGDLYILSDLGTRYLCQGDYAIFEKDDSSIKKLVILNSGSEFVINAGLIGLKTEQVIEFAQSMHQA